jgi:hypothetical protein
VAVLDVPTAERLRTFVLSGCVEWSGALRPRFAGLSCFPAIDAEPLYAAPSHLVCITRAKAAASRNPYA